MTHYYCYIQGPVDLTLETKIFKVKVGENQRDQIKKSLLDCYAQDTDGFFRIWDDTTDYHLRMLMSKRVEDGRICFLGSQTILTDIQTLYQKIVDGDVDSIKNPPYSIRNYLRVSAILSPEFFFRNNRRQSKPSVQAGIRKNLSPRDVTDETNGAIGLAIMLLLYWLGSLVGCWEAAVL